MNKSDIVKKALDAKKEQDNLMEDLSKASKHFEALRKLEKNQKITPEEKQDMSDIKQDYETFFDSDSESEANGKTPSWEKDKVEQILEYLKSEKSGNILMYEKLAKKHPDIFNVLKNKVTGKLHINIKPDVLKTYNENNTKLDTDLSNIKDQGTSKLDPGTLKGKEISDSQANKNNTDLNTKDTGKTASDSNSQEKKESIGDFLDSLPLTHNPFDDIGGGD